MKASSQAQLLADLLYAQFDTPILITSGVGSILAFSEQPPGRTDAPRRDGILTSNPSRVPDWLMPYLDPNQDLVRVPANEELHTLPRTVITVRHRGYPVGYVFALDVDQRIPSDWHLENERTLTALGLEIELLKSQSDQVQLAVRSTFSRDPATHRIGVDSLSSMRPFERSAPIRVLVSEFKESSSPGARLMWEGIPHLDGAWAEMNGRLVTIVNEDERAPLQEIKRFCAALERSTSASGAFHGIGGKVSGLDLARQSYEEALGSLRVAKIQHGSSAIAQWDHMGSWRTLVTIGRELGLRTIDPRVENLIAREREENIAVLRQYLERNGEVDKIAAEFHLHRSTVYSRLKRLESKYELDLNDAEDRLTIVLGLRLAQLFP